MSNWLKRGDRVIIIAGNEKGKTGKILRRVKDRVVVEGINIRKRHVKRSQDNPQGQILTFEAPIHASNVRACTGEGVPVKLRLRQGPKSKELIYRDGNQEILYRTIGEAR